MAKGSFLSDTFEQLAEFGQSTAKQTGKAVKETFIPLTRPSQKEKSANSKPGHTPLDFDKLNKSYRNQDDLKAKALAARLFQLVKSGDEKVLEEKKQKQAEKERAEAQEAENKKRKAFEEKQKQSAATPHGKERRSIFSHKKVAEREQTEVKPASGKQ
jgi:hypothetical protein